MKVSLLRLASWALLAAAVGAGTALAIVMTRELVTLSMQVAEAGPGGSLGPRQAVPEAAPAEPPAGVPAASPGSAGGEDIETGRTAFITLMALGTHDHYRTTHGGRYDLMIVSPEDKPSKVLRKARLAHPETLVFGYLNTMDVMLSRAIEGPRFWSKREDWFLHDSSGERIRVRVRRYRDEMSRFGMNVAHPGYQEWLGEQVVRLLQTGYDGVQLDNVETAWSYRLRYVGSFVSALPVELTEEQWYEGEIAMMRRIKAMAVEAGFSDREIIFNHMRAGEPDISRRFLEAADGANAEHWMNLEVGDDGGRWGWRSRIELARKAAAAGKRTNLLCTAKALSREESLFTFASYLMAMAGPRNTFWYGEPYRVERMPWHAFYETDLGSPAGDYGPVKGTDAYLRPFEKGLVVVNPSTRREEIPLGGRYWTETFNEVETITLEGRRGALLTRPDGEPPRRRVLEAEWCLKDADASGKTQGLRPVKGAAWSGGGAVAFDKLDVPCELTALFAPGDYRVVVQGEGRGPRADAAHVILGEESRRVAFDLSGRQVFDVHFPGKTANVIIKAAEPGVIVDRVTLIRIGGIP